MTDADTTTSAAPTDGTGAGMMAWFAWMIAKHEVTENTASGLRTGVRNVVTIDDDWEDVDMTRIDVDSQVQRFRIAKRGTLSDSSVDEYARRFRTCVESYRKWLDGDKDWHPVKVRSTAPTKKPAAKKPAPEPRQYDLGLGVPATRVQPDQQEERIAPPKEQEESADLVRYVIPLASGDDAVVYLPRDLTSAQAKRIGRVIASLAMDDEDDQPAASMRAIEP